VNTAQPDTHPLSQLVLTVSNLVLLGIE